MKRTRLMIMAAALVGGLLLNGCAKEPVEGAETLSGKRQLQAAIDEVTRASLDNVDIRWDAEDQLKVFYRTKEGDVTSTDFELIDGANSTSATFQEITSNMTDEDEILYVLYPAEGYWEFDGTGETELPCILSAEQSFDKLAMPMYGQPDDATQVVSFSNCASVFTLRLKGTGTVTKIRLTSTSRYLAGGGAIDVSVPDEPKFRVETSSFKPYDAAATKAITFDCGTLVLGEDPVEIPVVVPILPGTASFGVQSLAFEFYNGDDMVLLEKNMSSQLPVRNKKLLFPVWELSGAATGDEISTLLADAVAAGEQQLVLTSPIAGDQTIELPAGLPDDFQLSAPFADGTVIVKPADGASPADNRNLIFVNMATETTASFDFQFGNGTQSVDFYGSAASLTSDAVRLTLQNKNAQNGWPTATVKNLVIDGGSVLNYYAAEPESLQINAGYVVWKRQPSVLTPGEGMYAYWVPDPYTTSTSLVLLWAAEPLLPGAGTEEDPYRISTQEDLQRIGWQFTKSSEDLYAGQYFVLEQDIDAQGMALDRIGNCTNASAAGPAFAGNFNGQNHTISNIEISAGYYGVGLFGFTRNASISNLRLVNVAVQIRSAVGTNARWIGGLVGLMQGGSITNCSVENVKIDRSGYRNHYRLGGLVGFASGAENTISNCSVDGVTLCGWYTMGGLIGSIQASQTTIKDCSVDNVAIEHAYSDGDGTYASGPVIGDMGVAGSYRVDITGLTLGSWTITCTDPATSAAEWVAQDATAWPYVGEVVDGVTITVDGVAATIRPLTEADMNN